MKLIAVLLAIALMAAGWLVRPRSLDLAAARDFENGDRIGLFWITSPLTGTDHSMVWHDGGTGGWTWTKSRRPGRRATSATIQLAIIAALVVVLL